MRALLDHTSILLPGSRQRTTFSVARRMHAPQTRIKAAQSRFREFYMREKGGKKKKHSAASTDSTEAEEGETRLLFLTGPPLPLVSVPFDFSFSFPRSLINRALLLFRYERGFLFHSGTI